MFPRALRKEILLLICVKIAVLAVLYAAFFSHHDDAARVHAASEQHILGVTGE